MRELPTGTVTFLFTDIEGSTRLLRELGERYAALLEDHRRRLRAAVAAHGGVEVGTQGDGFFVAFDSAADALAAASEAQQALAGGAARVRMGIHTGEPLVVGGDYVGIDVHRAARLMAAGHGGQVLVSERTRLLLGDGWELRDLGVHRLKDLGGPERVYQLGEEEFRPLRTESSASLPVAVGPLLGRVEELAELVALLRGEARLLTIMGPGGVGKSRLALQVATELGEAFRDGVSWVPLSGLADPELVLEEVAQALGMGEDVAAAVHGRELLLVLDGFEHLLAAGPGVAALLSTSEGLRLLVTSRAALHVAGERRYLLEPLAAADAGALFVERARAVGTAVEADETVDAISRRLDCLPLAIELAAARTRVMSSETLLQRLDRALPLLVEGPRDAPAHQRALRATIAWSHDLLDQDAKALFARLAVFAGSFALAAAEDVCKADVDTLTELIDVSLLKALHGDRFELLATVREYAFEQLQASSEEPRLRARHSDFFGMLAERAYAQRHEREGEWTARLETDHDDLRAALEWRAANDPVGELELAGALGWFWVSRSHLNEGARRLAGAMERSDADGRARARALTSAGAVAAQRGRGEEARDLLGDAIALWGRLGDVSEQATALEVLGWAHAFRGANEEGLAVFQQSLELRRRAGDRAGETRALVGVCQLLVAQHHVDQAEELSQELLQLARQSGDVRSEHFACHFLAYCSFLRGDYERAQERYRESLQAALVLGDVLEMSFEVQGLAMTAAGKGDLVRAARLGGAVEAVWEERGIGVSAPFWDALLADHLGGARKRLGEEGDAAWANGKKLAFEDAIDIALAR